MLRLGPDPPAPKSVAPPLLTRCANYAATLRRTFAIGCKYLGFVPMVTSLDLIATAHTNDDDSPHSVPYIAVSIYSENPSPALMYVSVHHGAPPEV